MVQPSLCQIRKPLLHSPIDLPDGRAVFLAPAKEIRKLDERCITYTWLSRRMLFGEVYRRLLPDYFESMPHNSGVMISSFIRAAEIVPGLTFPGDIDVLVIPYENDELVLSNTLAVEIKIVRASFIRQGKSPNQFGFSQAKALLAAGFPYVAVGHLITSDRSPSNAWRDVGVTKIIDADTGAVGPIRFIKYDMLPEDLLRRSHGRLSRNCSDQLLGYFSAYPGSQGIWSPIGKSSDFNPCTKMSTLEGVYKYYQKNFQYFLWTRRFPPSHPVSISEAKQIKLFEQMREKMRRDFP